MTKMTKPRTMEATHVIAVVFIRFLLLHTEALNRLPSHLSTTNRARSEFGAFWFIDLS